MQINKGFIAYMVVFVLLVIGSFVMGNFDPVKPAVAQAAISNSVGASMWAGLSKGMALLAKFLLGGIAAGVASAVFAETRKAYKLWKRSNQTRRWVPGPNANWQKSSQKLSRQDMLLLALAGRLPEGKSGSQPALEMTQASSPSDDLDIEL